MASNSCRGMLSFCVVYARSSAIHALMGYHSSIVFSVYYFKDCPRNNPLQLFPISRQQSESSLKVIETYFYQNILRYPYFFITHMYVELCMCGLVCLRHSTSSDRRISRCIFVQSSSMWHVCCQLTFSDRHMCRHYNIY